MKRLREVAQGKGSPDDLTALRALGAKIPDPYCSGRSFAALPVGVCAKSPPPKS